MVEKHVETTSIPVLVERDVRRAIFSNPHFSHVSDMLRSFALRGCLCSTKPTLARGSMRVRNADSVQTDGAGLQPKAFPLCGCAEMAPPPPKTDSSKWAKKKVLHSAITRSRDDAIPAIARTFPNKRWACTCAPARPYRRARHNDKSAAQAPASRHSLKHQME